MVELCVKDHVSSKWSQYLHIYTDASKCPVTGRVGVAFCVPDLKYSKYERISNNLSVYTAELFAILLSLNWIKDVKPLRSVILSDSLSALQSISNYNWSRPTPIVYEILFLLTNLLYENIKVCFDWVPGHSNIQGNEMADRLAKLSLNDNIITSNIPLTVSEVMSASHNYFVKMWQQTWNECNTGRFFFNFNPLVSFK